MHFILVVAAALGVFGATWLFPFIATVVVRLRKRVFLDLNRNTAGAEEGGNRSDNNKLVLRIFIPAYNEGEALVPTVTSILSSVNCALKHYPLAEFSLTVGVDGADPRTAEAAESAGAEVIRIPARRGKWSTLNALMELSEGADWIVFADVGVIWGPEHVTAMLEAGKSRDVIAVAPTYRNPAGGVLETLFWSIECRLKAFESLLGGPVSMHGATVMYRYPQLKTVLQYLKGRNWLNDDVVIPLCMRSLFPSDRMVYLPELVVSDLPVTAQAKGGFAYEYRRRKRMMLGNVQWIRELLPGVVGSNFVAGMLAMRRVCRVMWAYWGVLFAAAAVLWMNGVCENWTFAAVMGAAGIVGVAGYIFVVPIRRIFDAARASLLAPYYLLTAYKLESVGWK